MPTAEQVRETEAGPLLDAMFFEVCWGWVQVVDSPQVWADPEATWHNQPEPVSTDANACEVWAMRWARENGLLPQITIGANDALVVLFSPVESHPIPLITAKACGTDWKAAFVRACIVAAEAMKLNPKGT